MLERDKAPVLRARMIGQLRQQPLEPRVVNAADDSGDLPVVGSIQVAQANGRSAMKAAGFVVRIGGPNDLVPIEAVRPVQ